MLDDTHYTLTILSKKTHFRVDKQKQSLIFSQTHLKKSKCNLLNGKHITQNPIGSEIQNPLSHDD